jgi:hypothetical protein
MNQQKNTRSSIATIVTERAAITEDNESSSLFLAPPARLEHSDRISIAERPVEVEQETSLFPPIEPVNEDVDFIKLYGELKDFFKNHVDLTDERNYSVLASWTFATYQLQHVPCTPHLSIIGQKGSGKTRLLETLREVCRFGWMALGVSAASLYYIVDVYKPTLLIDESQSYSNEEFGAIRSLFGVYRKGQVVPRIKYSAELSKAERIETFDIYSFKALAGLSQISDNVSDRCIVVAMLAASRLVARKVDSVEGQTLRNRLARWGEVTLRPIDESTWTGVDSRTSELFETLLLNTPSDEDTKVLMEIMRELSEAKKTCQRESLEADVLRTFYAIAQLKKSAWVSTTNIEMELNGHGHDFEDSVSARQVAAILHHFGFEARRRNFGRGFIIDMKRLTALSARYGIDLK